MAKRASPGARRAVDQMGLAAVAVVVLATAVMLMMRFNWTNQGVQVQGARTEVGSTGDEFK